METVGTVEYEVKLDKNKVNNNLKSIGKKITNWGNRIGNVLSGLIGFSMFSQAKSGWESLQSSLRQVSALTKGKENIKELTKIADRMSETFGTDATKSVNAFYQAISAGFNDNDSKKLVELANELSSAATQAGHSLSPTGAINALTTILNAYSLSASKATKVSDLLTNATNFGKTSINELASSISTIAPISSAFGMSIKDVLINISALTKGGIITETTTVGLRQMLSEMAKSSTAAGKALQDNLGFGLQVAFEKGMNLQQIMEQGLLPAVKGNSAEFVNLFGNIQAGNIAMAIAKNNFKSITRVSNGFKNSINSTAEAAKSATNNQITKYRNGINELKNSLVNAITWIGGLGNAIVTFGAILATFKIASFIAKILTMISSYSALAVAKTAAQTGVGAIVAVPAVLGIIGTGLAAVGLIVGTAMAHHAFSKTNKIGQSKALEKGGGMAGDVGVMGNQKVLSKNRTISQKTPNPINNMPKINNITNVNITTTPYGTNVTGNGSKINVQTNYGGN